MTVHDLYQIYLQNPSVETDSRKVKKGDLFFALKGELFDGNQYAATALEAGAAYAVVDDALYAAAGPRYILVENVLDTLQQLARYHRMQLRIPILAITGSNGKTTTKELVTAVLASQYRTYATPGNFNNHIGVPLTLLRIRPDAEMAIVEMGANHIGEIASYCTIALPSHGLITNCGKAHLEGFGSIEGVMKAKGELYDYLRETGGTAFRNTDLDYLATMSKGIPEQVTYGTANAQIIGKPLTDSIFTKLVLLSNGMETVITTQLVGAYNLPNVLAAVAVGRQFHIPIDRIKEAIEQYSPSNSRSQWLELGDNKIILDAYNANPSSMKLAIENLAALPAENKWILLGGMKEMGKESEAEHLALVRQLEQLGFQNVILTGPEFANLQHAFRWFENASQLKDYLDVHPIRQATILVKGSRGSKMETVLDAL